MGIKNTSKVPYASLLAMLPLTIDDQVDNILGPIEPHLSMILYLRVVWESGNKPAILSTRATPGI